MMRCSVFIIAAFVLRASAIRSPPTITKQPPNGVFPFKVAKQKSPKEYDKPFFIECEAEGEPAPVYKWTKDGMNFNLTKHAGRIFQQPGHGTLNVSRPSEKDVGWYQCFATNEWGTAASNMVLLRKVDSMSFKYDTATALTAIEGEPFKIPCQPPNVWPKPKVFWLRESSASGVIESINNPRMTLDPEGNLWFSNVTRNDASDDFYYVCAASPFHKSYFDYQLGEKYLLEVIPSNSSANRYNLTEQYVSGPNVIAVRGKKMELYCIYGGTPLPETGWSKNDAPLKPNGRVTHGNYGKSLIIKTVNFNDAGIYTCNVWNNLAPSKSHSISLTIEAAPYFTIEPEIINAAENETAEFRCEADGVPEPQISWTRNGKPIVESSQNSRRKVSTNSIVIDKLTKNDTANYGCNATNSYGYVYKDFYVNVTGPPEQIIIRPPTNLTTVDGKNVILTCRVIDLPESDIFWILNRRELTGDRYETLNNGDLEIKNVTVSDTGTYTCYASNDFGKNVANARLIVEDHTISGTNKSQQRREIETTRNYATAGWFIGMMLAIAFLLFVLTIDCVIKHGYRGTHATRKRKLAAGYPDDEDGLIHEDSPPLDTKSADDGRASTASSSHRDGKRPESDTDPMAAEYGEGNTGDILSVVYQPSRIQKVRDCVIRQFIDPKKKKMSTNSAAV